MTHVLEAIRTLGHGPGDLGTLAIGTMGPWDLVASPVWSTYKDQKHVHSVGVCICE